MDCKDSFLMLTKEQKRSGRVYLTEGQVNFLRSKLSVAHTDPITIAESPTKGLTVYDDSQELFTFNYKLPLLLVYQIKTYCEQNSITYTEFFKELIGKSPAGQIKPSPLTTIREQVTASSRYNNTNIDMAKKGFITAAETSAILDRGDSGASRYVQQGLKCTRVGKLLYFKKEDVEAYKVKLDKTITKRQRKNK